ncbi:MAG: HAMP domain-containing protein [Sulfurimonas sp.]|nr:HAMP domain-containing protein [Sulfurimonas sp.]PHQ91966.1 MAG: hypothetical protein COB42_02530 [Sulfurimonas sp.]
MFKFNSLFTRTFLLIASSMTLIMLLFAYYSIKNKEAALIDVINSKAKTIAKSIALVSSDAMVIEDYSFLVQHNEKVVMDNQEIEYIMISKKQSTMNIINKRKGWSVEDTLPSALVPMQLKTETAHILKSPYSENKNNYHFTYPIIFSSIEWGWIAIGFSLEKYYAQMRDEYLNELLLLFSTLVLSLVFAFSLTKWLVGPIILLQNAAKQVSGGDFSAKVKITSKDEIGELAHSFNAMVETIKVSDEKLRNSNIELEKRVTLRTQELHELNVSLDKRVKDEVHKRTEQEQILIQQSRFAAMGEMIGNIAHQWRQPLNALGLLLQNIENAYEMNILDDAYISRTLEKGNRLTSTMSQTIDDFRNFFKQNKEAKVFSILSSIEDSLEMIQFSFSSNMIKITHKVDEKLCIKGFASEFSQVLLNILNNAKDALVEKEIKNKKILISAIKNNKEISITIEDNAGGIPIEILDKVFDPYFTTKEEGKGTGIGLYMSKTIIENNMSGKLSVINTDEGAKFTITMKVEVCDEKIA